MHALYGSPALLRGLVDLPPKSAQLSPLTPGAERMEDFSSHFESITMLVPPGTLERRYSLALALTALKPHGNLVALGPKDKGGSRIRKELEEFGCEVHEEARSHAKICGCRKPKEENTALRQALADGAPRFDETLGLETQPGVFSWNRIDPGSALLARHIPLLHGFGADLGAGIGFLSREILNNFPDVKKLFLVELDRRAVDCARKNVTSPKAEIRWADVRENLNLTRLDFVVTNPPFHDGGIEDQDLGRIFIQQAAYALKPEGLLLMVANKHLPYEETLRSVFSSVKVLAEESGFKIFEALR